MPLYICAMFGRASRVGHVAPLLLAGAWAVAACGQRAAAGRAPSAEFLVSADDSSFWIASGVPGLRIRGSPLLLAHYDGRFYEVYTADDDYSFENALLV